MYYYSSLFDILKGKKQYIDHLRHLPLEKKMYNKKMFRL